MPETERPTAVSVLFASKCISSDDSLYYTKTVMENISPKEER